MKMSEQFGQITSSGSKPILNQDLAEILTLSKKGPLSEWKLSSFDGTSCRRGGLSDLISSKCNRSKNYE